MVEEKKALLVFGNVISIPESEANLKNSKNYLKALERIRESIQNTEDVKLILKESKVKEDDLQYFTPYCIYTIKNKKYIGVEGFNAKEFVKMVKKEFGGSVGIRIQ